MTAGMPDSSGTFTVVSEKGKPVERRGRKATGPSTVSRATERQEPYMSDYTHSARHLGRDAFGAPEHTTQGTMSGAGPMRPEEGSPLALLLRRQTSLSAPGRLLGFVPAQVR
jgi:hypothetical protein